MRGRGYSYSPSPPRGYRGRGRSPSPRGRYGGRSRDLPTSLLVRNLRHDCRPEDLRKPFGQFGPLKDIYLPRDYYSGLAAREPRGFGFVQYVDPADAAEAKYQMDGQILLGRELTVVYAEENRKKPIDMRARERTSRPYGHRRSPRFARSPHHSRSRSPPARHSSRYSRSPRHARSPSRSPPHHSPSPRRLPPSRSASPEDRRTHRERSYSQSPYAAASRSRSPVEEDDDDAAAVGYARKSSHRERSRSYSQ